jgi:hypothetical protein
MKNPHLIETAGGLEMREDGAAVRVLFNRGPNRIILTELEADEALARTGAVDRFMEAVVAHAREKRLKLESRDAEIDAWFDARRDLARELLVDRLPAQDGTQGALEDLGREGGPA